RIPPSPGSVVVTRGIARMSAAALAPRCAGLRSGTALRTHAWHQGQHGGLTRTGRLCKSVAETSPTGSSAEILVPAPATAVVQAPRPEAQHTMRCLEVWGGNQAVDNGVVMAGLDAWLFSRPYQGHSAGGDIHYVSSCAAGMLTRLLVADVSGHGEAV